MDATISTGTRPREGFFRVVLLGNPNTGKTTLFNRLSGLRAKTSNFPGTTQDARVGTIRDEAAGGQEIEIIDLPGVYSLELDQSEAMICREVLAGRLAPMGERAGDPGAVLIVMDATNLIRNLIFAGEVLRRRLPTVVAINMVDLAAKQGIDIEAEVLAERLGCPVCLIGARSGEGVDALLPALRSAPIPNITPPGTTEGLEEWADRIFADVVHPAETEAGRAHAAEPLNEATRRSADATDAIDRWTMHPLAGPIILTAILAGLFYAIFSLAAFPMDGIDWIFEHAKAWLGGVLPKGILAELFVDGIVAGVGATVIFLPQICLLFFMLSLLEDTGYLARAAMLMDRLLRPFGLPGHAFIPLLGSHACALPGIMATRAIPDFKDRLATILVAPFMTCSARLPVYVLLTTLLFRDRPAMAALAFIGCYALGIAAGLLSAVLARRTILRGKSRPMVLELPTYKVPSVRTAIYTTWDRGWVFMKNAGTNILAICVVLWWLGSYPKVEVPASVVEWRAQAESAPADEAEKLTQRADLAEAKDASARSFIGMVGRGIQPVFSPLGYDWQLSIGVLSSFAAREVFVSTMAVVTTGDADPDSDGVMEQIQQARRDDGSPIFTVATSWSLLIYYVLAMQCLPTLAVTAREARGKRWAFLQLAWMSGMAYAAALIVYQVLRAFGVS
jgi:ferrous iron transport protein B